jgi:chromate reductase
LQIVEIGGLPLYNSDHEASPDAATVAFREQVSAADAILFVTPEYNRSVPGALKNAIDVGSRPYGHSVWSGKPGAVISLSPGAMGGFGANHHLRQSLVFLDVPVLQQPEAYIGGAGSLFDAAGDLANPDTGKFLDKFLQAFAAWIEINSKA